MSTRNDQLDIETLIGHPYLNGMWLGVAPNKYHKDMC